MKMVNWMDKQNFARRPIVLQIDNWGKEGIPQRNQIVIQNPVASCFKVTNGKYMAIVTIDELGVEIKAFDKDGNEERLTTKKLSL